MRRHRYVHPPTGSFVCLLRLRTRLSVNSAPVLPLVHACRLLLRKSSILTREDLCELLRRIQARATVAYTGLQEITKGGRKAQHRCRLDDGYSRNYTFRHRATLRRYNFEVRRTTHMRRTSESWPEHPHPVDMLRYRPRRLPSMPSLVSGPFQARPEIPRL